MPDDTTEEADHLRCDNCKYDLHGLTDPRCPECGEGFDPASQPKSTRLKRNNWYAAIAFVLSLWVGSGILPKLAYHGGHSISLEAFLAQLIPFMIALVLWKKVLWPSPSILHITLFILVLPIYYYWIEAWIKAISYWY